MDREIEGIAVHIHIGCSKNIYLSLYDRQAIENLKGGVMIKFNHRCKIAIYIINQSEYD